MKFKVMHPFSLHLRKWKPKAKFGPSMTSPDKAMSVKELLQRFVNGMPLGGATPLWDPEGSSLGVDPRTLDLVDIQQLKMATAEEIATLRKDLEYANYVAEEKRKEEWAAEQLKKRQEARKNDEKKEEAPV